MAKIGRARRSREERIAKRKYRIEMGRGLFRVLTLAQANSPEFAEPKKKP